MVCQVLLYEAASVYIYPLPHEPPSTPDLTPLGRHRADPCVPQQRPPHACCPHGSTHLSMPLSQFVSLSASPDVSTLPFSRSVSPFLPCKQICNYPFVACLSHSLNSIFCRQKFLILTSFRLLFSFLDCAFGVVPKISLPNSSFVPELSSRIFCLFYMGCGILVPDQQSNLFPEQWKC